MSSRPDRVEIARSIYRAFAAGERGVVEAAFAPELSFHSPPDPELDREGYFERCWPGAGNRNEFEFVRAIESGDEVVITYEATRPDGSRFRNTEVLTFAGERIVAVEVYFGWDL
jgi:ketosteroid isomerase-like protein